MKPPDSGDRYGLEAQLAVHTNELKALRRELEMARQMFHDEILGLKIDVHDLESKAQSNLSDAQARELCRQVVNESSQSAVGNKEAVMRVVTFAVSIATAIFVIRGGR